jgi:hypothetical protein
MVDLVFGAELKNDGLDAVSGAGPGLRGGY